MISWRARFGGEQTPGAFAVPESRLTRLDPMTGSLADYAAHGVTMRRVGSIRSAPPLPVQPPREPSSEGADSFQGSSKIQSSRKLRSSSRATRILRRELAPFDGLADRLLTEPETLRGTADSGVFAVNRKALVHLGANRARRAGGGVNRAPRLRRVSPSS
jgi:hypothetical protein